MSDTIDRQAAIDVVKHAWAKGLEPTQYLEELPSTQPEPYEDAVSRRRLLSDLKELTAAWGKYPVMEEQIKGVEAAIGYVETIPSAQPEIIRCKDCQFYSPMNRETKTGICNLTIHQNFGDNWFCAGAERKTDGDGRKEGTG